MLVALKANRPRWWWTAYGGLSCAAMYTHYTAAFVLAVQLAWILWLFPAARRPALIANLLAAAVFLLWLPELSKDFSSPSLTYSGLVAPFSFNSFHVFTAAWAFANPWGGVGAFYGQPFYGMLLAVAIGALGAVVSLGRAATDSERQQRRERRRFIWLFVILGLATPLGLAAVSVVGDDQCCQGT